MKDIVVSALTGTTVQDVELLFKSIRLEPILKSFEISRSKVKRILLTGKASSPEEYIKAAQVYKTAKEHLEIKEKAKEIASSI
ncbi:hypothetical protein KTO58_01135 [Chitinophaga pendula]|uniref:hypothetical protein n=1 Tax=Chitinophaga TaxID=79328 RepID=UPI0012FD398B|nr:MULTISPECIES: hypothetical protein [Chitinophaga]UCJ07809.1 hypothetical protein KTO58_01135 [Chitinophaga pendula]